MAHSSLRRSLRAGIVGVASLEDNTGLGAPGAAVDSVPEHETVAAQIVELNAEDAKIDQLEDHKDEVENAAVALEAFIVSLEQIAENGGLTPDAALVANHAVDSILEPVNIESSEVMPSLESFGGSADRRHSTTVSVESLKEKLTQIWEYIKGIFARIRKQMKEYWLRVWDAAPRLQKRAEALYTKAQDMSATGKKEKEKIDIGGLAAKLQIGTTLPAANAVLTGVKSAADTLMGGAYMSKATEYVNAVDTHVGNLKFDSDESFTSSAAALKQIGAIKVEGLADKAVDSNDKRFANMGKGLVATVSDPLPGNKMFVYVHPSEGAGDDLRDYLERSLAKSQYQLADSSEKAAEKPASTEVDVLSQEEIKAIAKGVSELAAVIVKHKKGWEDQEKLKDSMLKAGDKVANASKSAKDLSAGNQAIATAAVRLIQKANDVVDQPIQKFTSYAIATGSALLTLCEKSMAQYK